MTPQIRQERVSSARSLRGLSDCSVAGRRAVGVDEEDRAPSPSGDATRAGPRPAIVLDRHRADGHGRSRGRLHRDPVAPGLHAVAHRDRDRVLVRDVGPPGGSIARARPSSPRSASRRRGRRARSRSSCRSPDSTTRTTVMLTMAAAAAATATAAISRRTLRRRRARPDDEHALLEPGRRFGLGRQLRDGVGGLGELGDVGLAASAAVDVQHRLGPLGAPQHPERELGGDLAQLVRTSTCSFSMLLGDQCEREPQQRSADPGLGGAERDALDLAHFTCGVAEQTGEHDRPATALRGGAPARRAGGRCRRPSCAMLGGLAVARRRGRSRAAPAGRKRPAAAPAPRRSRGCG